MNWKGCGRKRSFFDLRHLTLGTEENNLTENRRNADVRINDTNTLLHARYSDWLDDRSSIPSRDLSCHHRSTETGSEVHPASYPMGTGSYCDVTFPECASYPSDLL
jgi:hypothetical protein